MSVIAPRMRSEMLMMASVPCFDSLVFASSLSNEVNNGTRLAANTPPIRSSYIELGALLAASNASASAV